MPAWNYEFRSWSGKEGDIPDNPTQTSNWIEELRPAIQSARASGMHFVVHAQRRIIECDSRLTKVLFERWLMRRFERWQATQAEKPRIVFIGGTRRGLLTLSALLDHFQVVGVISLRQDDHEVDRCEPLVRKAAEASGVPLVETKFLKKPEFADILRSWHPDIGIVVGCRILIPESLYSIPRLGMLAVHDSLLPEYRGFAPLNWALINGETQTGVTLFQIDQGTDTGDIFGQRGVPIGPRTTAPELYQSICEATVDVLLDRLPGILSGKITGIPQDPNAGSFSCARAPEDGLLHWQRQTTAEIDRQIRALTYPYPGAFCYYQGQKLIIESAEPIEHGRCAGRVPGRVYAIGEGHVDVLTIDGAMRLYQIRTEAGPVPASAVIRSIRGTLTDAVSVQSPMLSPTHQSAPLEAERPRSEVATSAAN